jgi:hypothetical protein
MHVLLSIPRMNELQPNVKWGDAVTPARKMMFKAFV